MNLIAAAIIGIAIIVLLIAVCKVHPFLSLACRLIRDGRVRGRGIRQGIRQFHVRRRFHHR